MAGRRGSEDVALELRAMQDRRRDLLDRLRRRVERRDAFALHQLLGLAHLVAAIVERRVLAARAPLLADLAQALGLDREPEQPLACAARSSAAACGRRSRRASAENSRRGCRTAARGRATSASCRSARRRPGSPAPCARSRVAAPSSCACVKLIASMRAKYSWLLAMPCERPAACELFAPSSASSGAMKIWNRSSVSAFVLRADRLARVLVDDRAEHDRPLALASRRSR